MSGMKYDLRKLAQVVAVARAGSFSGAAEKLHMTQPALSRNIAAVEKSLGITLFERGRRGAVLTSEGSFAVQAIESLLREADSLEHNLQMITKGDFGRIEFGVGPMIGSLVLPSMMETFLKQSPSLQMKALIKPAEVLFEELYEGHIELFFCGLEQVQFTLKPDVDVQPIATVPVACVVRADHPLSSCARLEAADMADYPILVGQSLPVERASGGQLVCDNYHILRDTTLSSDGIWITSPRMIAAELAAGTLTTLSFVTPPHHTETNVCVVSRKGFTLSPGARKVRDFVQGFLQR